MMIFLKEKKKAVLLGAALVAAAAVGGISISANASVAVTAYTVDKGSLESQIEVIRIPLDALSEDEEGSYVFVAKDGKATKEFVECGIRNEEMVEIRSGLSEGTLVVWKDTLELADGMGVKVNN